MIELVGTLAYRDRTVLGELELRIAPGERVALLGGNGAGKTTLLRALTALLPVAGRLTIDGRPIARAEEAVAAGVGLVFQNPDDQLFCTTVLEDVAYGPRHQGLDAVEATRRAEAALAELGALTLAARPIGELSFGEKKRVCLAGILAMRPRLLLLDEPNAGLDPVGEEELLACLTPLRTTLVVATHAVDLVPRLCDRVLLLAGQRLAADGAPEQVFADLALLRRARLRAPSQESWQAAPAKERCA